DLTGKDEKGKEKGWHYTDVQSGYGTFVAPVLRFCLTVYEYPGRHPERNRLMEMACHTVYFHGSVGVRQCVGGLRDHELGVNKPVKVVFLLCKIQIRVPF